MRLLLDNHLSWRRVATPLRKAGHDVLALQQAPPLQTLADEELLAYAAEDSRILVTRNARDFDPIVRAWADTRRRHAGCILLWSIDHSRHAVIVARVGALLAERPRQDDWRHLVLAI